MPFLEIFWFWSFKQTEKVHQAKQGGGFFCKKSKGNFFKKNGNPASQIEWSSAFSWDNRCLWSPGPFFSRPKLPKFQCFQAATAGFLFGESGVKMDGKPDLSAKNHAERKWSKFPYIILLARSSGNLGTKQILWQPATQLCIWYWIVQYCAALHIQ